MQVFKRYMCTQVFTLVGIIIM